VQELASRLDSSRAENHQLQRQIAALENQNAALKETHQKLREASGEAEQDGLAWGEEKEKLVGEIGEMRLSLRTLREAYDETAGKLKALEEARSMESDAMAKRLAERNQAVRESNDLKATVERLTMEADANSKTVRFF
jgi:chromosome segregation ATPase